VHQLLLSRSRRIHTVKAAVVIVVTDGVGMDKHEQPFESTVAAMPVSCGSTAALVRLAPRLVGAEFVTVTVTAGVMVTVL
jgi:hypothetical protein